MQYDSCVNRQWVMLYLIYSMRIKITMMFLLVFVVMDLVSPSILSLLKPPSPRLHRSWFHNGCQTGFARSPASYQSPRNLISHEKSCLFQERRGEYVECFPSWHLTNRLLFKLKFGEISLIVDVIFKTKWGCWQSVTNTSIWKNINHKVGDKRFLDTSSFIVFLLENVVKIRITVGGWQPCSSKDFI